MLRLACCLRCTHCPAFVFLNPLHIAYFLAPSISVLNHMNKSIAAENSATLNGQKLLKWLKTKNQCFALISQLFTKRTVCLKEVGSGEGACPSPDYHKKTVPTQHPIFTPGPDNMT